MSENHPSAISRALISVSDKTGLVEFARALQARGVQLLSTGGSAQVLRDAGVAVTDVSEHTGFPEIMDGRVKTLHPKIHGGLLGRRDLAAHVEAMRAHGIAPIDLLVVNLYPFRETIAKPNCTFEDAIENIDIGGPAMVRAAAKNHAHVAVVTDPADYALVLQEMQAHGNAISARTRFAFACKAFSHTAEYDGAVSNYLTSLSDDGTRAQFPARLNLQFDKAQDLRYGENPHQQAAFYVDRTPAPGALAGFTQLQGKELSYNNIADADAAWECVKAFAGSACVIVKHANPCGVALGADALNAYQKAFATDPVSAFGGIIAFNCEVDAPAAQAVSAQFLEVLIAPGYSAAALQVLKDKQNVRVLSVPLARGANPNANAFDLKRIGGGLLLQTPDSAQVEASALKVVSKRAPSTQELNDLLFAFRVVKYVKSNAIVFVRDGQTLGIGAGQMSRVDSTRIAANKAEQAKLSLQGSVAASDAFFPFRDGLDQIARAGASAVIQPGGSMRDAEVIAAGDEHGIAMVLTGVRHFRH